MFVEDKNKEILAHTFVQPFPQILKGANPITEEQSQNIALIRMEGTAMKERVFVRP